MSAFFRLDPREPVRFGWAASDRLPTPNAVPQAILSLATAVNANQPP